MEASKDVMPSVRKEMELRIEYLEHELVTNEDRLTKRIKYFTTQITELLAVLSNYNIIPKHNDINQTESFNSIKNLLVTTLNG